MKCPTCEHEMTDVTIGGAKHCKTCGTYVSTWGTITTVPALVERVREYQHNHDLYGDGDIRTGKAWDKMRECVSPEDKS